VQVYISRPEASFAAVPGEQLQILHHMGVEVAKAEEVAKAGQPELVVDGTSFELEKMRWESRQEVKK
jgi:peptide subunit release factor 1 (eRF1)